MLYQTKYLFASTALALCLMQAAPSFSEMVVQETTTETQGGGTTVKKTVTETAPDSTTVHTTVTTEQPGTTTIRTRWRTVQEINFVDFDVNGDGIQSTNEIGELLFSLYDTDGNNVIDNVEYGRRSAVTVMPVQQDRVVSYDFDGDGKIDETKYTYETFMQDTQLSRYDKNMNGLSPYEFTGLDFLAVDINKDQAVDLKEWQGTYIASIDKANKANARLNR
jgi:hypothetical protein